MSTFDMASLVFVFAAGIGIANERYLKWPRVIALLICALLASLLIMTIGTFFTSSNLKELAQHRIEAAHLPRILLDGLLALLLFAASLHVDLRELRSQAWAVFGLATLGVIVATALLAFGLFATFHLAGIKMPLAWCFVLGAVLAPTDAVAVEGLLRRIRIPTSLRALVTGEALFNDGTAVILFFAALAATQGQAGVVGHGHIVFSLFVEGAAGVVLGILAGYLAQLAMRRIRDENLAVTISLALALSTYRLAVAFGISGPIAVVVSGIVLANQPARSFALANLREKLVAFWSLVDDLLNTLLFILMGFEMLAIDLSPAVILPLLLAIPLAFLARLVSVCALVPLLPRGSQEKSRAIAALSWLGLRGGISIALVLNLPPTPYRAGLSAVCYGVVIFTIVVQGLLTPRVLKALYGGKLEPALSPPGLENAKATRTSR
ncbi:MAG: sodium:proton antiporter [Hyphomicrobiales bacterium]|nr:sodium:proton antiporter [Hyphomicrobiales bacterium]